MRIINYIPSTKEGGLQGHASIEFASPWGMIQINNIAVLRNKSDGRRWFAFPQKMTDRKNEKGYSIFTPHIEFRQPFESINFQNQFFTLLDVFNAARSSQSALAD